MSRPLFSIALVLALMIPRGATGAALPTALRTALDRAPASAKPSVSIRVSTRDLQEGSAALTTMVQGRAEGIIEDQGFPLAREGADAEIAIVVRPMEGDDIGFAVEHRTTRGGKPDGDLSGVEVCSLCTDGELAAKVETIVRATLSELEPPAQPEPVAIDETDLPGAGEGPQPAPDRRRRPLGPLGKAGIGVLVPGAIALGVGIGLVIREPTPIDGTTDQRNTRKPGAAVLAVGAALVVTGIALLATDRVRAKKRSTARRLVPSGGGLAVRF